MEGKEYSCAVFCVGNLPIRVLPKLLGEMGKESCWFALLCFEGAY